MSTRATVYSLLVLFVILSTYTSHLLWFQVQWRMIPHMLLIMSIALIGENLVSSKGYYHYTRQDPNGPFVRNTPVWIVFLWVFCIQASLLIPLALGFGALSSILTSGLIASSIDFYFFEPYMSRRRKLWLWNSVDSGYFGFIPSRLNRFTAPPGNYITWLVFPILANSFLALLCILP
ncbi:MAG: hypothetical protein ACFFF9_11710 [Candidatus Thorarchaeota archaeon]